MPDSSTQHSYSLFHSLCRQNGELFWRKHADRFRATTGCRSKKGGADHSRRIHILRKRWLENGKQKVKPKSCGTSLMVSGFVCPCHGFMKSLADPNKKSYITFEAGKNRDGWFTNEDLAKQLREDIIPLAEDLYPGCEILFAFDNSQSHHKSPIDGLDASKLPLKCGGKNAPKMRDGFYHTNTGERITQAMVHPDGNAKGLRLVLTERGKWRNNMLRICKYCKDKISHEDRVDVEHGLHHDHVLAGQSCCAWYVLSQEPDFKAQRELLREIVEDAGHSIIYYPKYHCELNFIEKIWGFVKIRTRAICNYTPHGLKADVPSIIDQVPISFVRRVFRKCMRFADGYRRGLEGPLLEYASKRFSSHRRIPDFVMAELETQYNDWNQKRLQKRKR